MSQVTNISHPETEFTLSGCYRELRAHQRQYEILVVGIILGALQVADAVLTACGISRWGTAAEGNPLLRFLMHEFGYLPALAMVKALAILVVALLCILAVRVKWITFAMKTMIVIYLGAAVIPWTALLLLKS